MFIKNLAKNEYSISFLNGKNKTVNTVLRLALVKHTSVPAFLMNAF